MLDAKVDDHRGEERNKSQMNDREMRHYGILC